MPTYSRKAIIERFRALNTWKRGGIRAPHKPLLLLLTLARLSRGESSAVDYRTVAPPLAQLLREFGPVRRSVHPEYPFWYLRNDGIWQVSDVDDLERRKGKDTPTKAAFQRRNPTGGLVPGVERALQADRDLLAEVVAIILENHFPATLHDDILAEVGISFDRVLADRRTRDPAFREKVLRAYGRRCAICGFDVRLADQPLALEAAHVKWHQAGGPDETRNGLALCTLHHKLLDRGAFTVSPDHRLLVSQDANGSQGLRGTLLRFHGRPIAPPQTVADAVDPRFAAWHRREVFKHPARE